MHFDHDSELLQDVTQSRPLLRKALDAVQLPDDSRPQMRQAGQGGGYPTNGNVRRAGTTLYDAIFLGSDEIMSRQHGRKALILLTDGVDEGSKTSMYEAIRAAQKSDTLVYSILFSDRDAYGQQQIVPMLGGMGRRRGMPMPPMSNAQHPDGKKVLQQISRETGGGFFEVSKKESIDDIYREIQEELRNQYSIGYVSDQGTNSATFRRISLTAKDKALTVQAPEGYYPVGK
jgi:VWFA-related protein